MKSWKISRCFHVAALAGVAVGLAGCGQDAATQSLNQQLAEQSQKLDDHEKMLTEQDKKITQLSWQLEVLQQTLDRQAQASAAAPEAGSALLAVDLDSTARSETIRQLVGFNARLSAGLGFAVYSKALGDLDSDLAQQLLEIKNDNFVEQTKIILKQYDLASELWDKLSRADTDYVTLTPMERYDYSMSGINFADGYRAKLSDVQRVWRAASDQTQRLIETDKDSSPDTVSMKN
jgi:uncharacterized coiled-coil protein SlyX